MLDAQDARLKSLIDIDDLSWYLYLADEFATGDDATRKSVCRSIKKQTRKDEGPEGLNMPLSFCRVFSVVYGDEVAKQFVAYMVEPPANKTPSP